jgi:hypothetical protein
MSQYVVWYDSSETGAPTLNNAAGSLLAVLKACLVTGFNVKTVTSISVAGGVATASCAGHGYSSLYGKDVDIAGCSEAALNGRKALTSITTNAFVFAAVGVADGVYSTGAITARRSPLGWVEQYAGANKSMFKRTDATCPAVMLRVDDTNVATATATDARCVMVESASATDIDTYPAASPTAAQQAGGFYLNKGLNNTTPKQWTLVGDGKRFFLITQYGSTVLPAANGVANAMFFGDITSLRVGDQWNTVLFASSSAHGGSNGNSTLGASLSAPSAAGQQYVARGWAQLAASVSVAQSGISTTASGDPSQPVSPSPMDSGMVMFPGMLVREYDTAWGHPIRGVMKPLVQLLGRYPFAHQQIIDNIENLPGRKMIALANSQSAAYGMVGVDLTGPWD